MAVDLTLWRLANTPAGNAVELVINPPPPGIFEATISASLEDVNAAVSSVSPVEIVAAATLDDATAAAVIQFFWVINASATLDDATATAAPSWAAGVYRGLEVSKSGGFDSFDIEGRDGKRVEPGVLWRQAVGKRPEPAMHWADRKSNNAERGAGWVNYKTQNAIRGIGWELTPPQNPAFVMPYSALDHRHGTPAIAWDWLGGLSPAFLSWYKSPPRKHRYISIDYIRPYTSNRQWAAAWGEGTERRRAWNSITWEVAEQHFWRWLRRPADYVAPPPTPQPIHLVIQCKPPTAGHNYQYNLILMRDGCPYATPPVIVVSDGAYLVSNTLSVKRVSDNQIVSVNGLSLQLAANDWAWGASLQLEGAAGMALVSPVAGSPVAIEIDLNGYKWRVYVEEYSESRQFGKLSYSASGRSLAAELGAPYFPARTYTEASTKTAAQLIDAELLYTGWAAAYHDDLVNLVTADWTIPGGAWTYQNKTPMEAITTVAAAIGARAYADRTLKVIHVAPLYPVSPWDWATATPDAIIYPSRVTQTATKLQPKPAYNQVIVSGANQGVIVTVRRTGTAGDIGAQMVTDALITYPQAGRERGRNILSDTGKQASVSLTLPLTLETGLIEPGELVQVQESTPWRGIVTGVSISAAFGVVTQTVEVQRHYA